MIPDLAWWGRLAGLLATEAALLVALATLVARLVRTAQLRRLVWQSAFLAVALVWTVELAGGRSWLASWREPLPAKRQLTARVVGSAPVVGEEVAFEFPAEPAVPPPAPPPQPNWWPGLLWLAGLGALGTRALLLRAWLALKARGSRRKEAPFQRGARNPELGIDQSLVTSAATETVVERLRVALGLCAVRVQTWPHLRGPVAFGIFRPTVAVPADFETRFTPVQREAMLAHELAHLANRDPLWLLVAELVCALAWWHPAVWWARRQFRAACESAADEASTLVPGGRVALAEALVNFGRELTAPGGVGVAGSGLKSELARRVKVLVGDRLAWTQVSRPCRWFVRGSGLLIVAGIGLVPNSLALTGAPFRELAGALGNAEKLGDVESGAKKDLALEDARLSEVLSPLVPDVPMKNTGLAYDRPSGVNSGHSRSYAFMSNSPNGLVPSGTGVIAAVDPAVAAWLGTETPAPDELRATSQAVLTHAALEMKAAKLALDETKVRYGEGSPEITSAESRYKEAEGQIFALNKPLYTRQFQVVAEDFKSHLLRFLPTGETNFQVAVCAFCATNGAEFTAGQFVNSPADTPSAEQPAVYYDERTGVLFARAKLVNLARIERAIQGFAQPPPIQPAVTYEQQRDRVRGSLERIVIPNFEVTDETLGSVVRRLEQAAKEADPQGRGMNFIINEPDDTGALAETVIKTIPPLRETKITEVIAQVVAGAEKRIQADIESYAVVFNAWRDESKQLHTRRFAALGPAFLRHVEGFLSQGQTNLQVAVRAFCATNGVEFQNLDTKAIADIPPQGLPAAFYNDRTGILFVRATLADLERIDQAIRRLNLPAEMPAGTTRAALEQQLIEGQATLTELRTRYREAHPKMVEALTRLADLKAALKAPANGPAVASVTAGGNTSPTNPSPLITRLFRVDTDKFLARIHAEADVRALTNGVLAGTDPIEDAARRIEQLPNRSLNFAGGGPGPTSPGTLPRATPAVLLGESAPSRIARSNPLANVQVTVREYLRGHGVEFPASDSATGQPLKEPVFFNDRDGTLAVRASQEDMERVERALDGLGQPGPVAGGDQPRQSKSEQGNSRLIQTLESDRQVAAEQISRLRQDLENGTGVRSELEAKLKRLTDVEAKIKEQLGHVKQAANGGDRPESGPPQVQLTVFFAEITEGSSDDIGLDWLFGQACTNNPALESGLVTNLPAGRTPLNGDRLRVDRLAVAGQSAVLSAEQFTALKERLEGRSGVDFLTAPKVTTLSGRQAQVTVGEVRTLVTGVVTKDGSPTNDARVSYVTDQVSVGPLVDLFPAAEGSGWRVKVVASVTEFLGYDEPGTTNRVQAQTFGGKPLNGTAPLPRLRMRETQAEALAHGGETIALRGPLADEVIRFKDKVPVLGDIPMLGRLFRSEGRQVRHKRLYVFIQPVSIDAAGNRQPAPETK